jgi:hypothetical protein
MKIRNQDGRSQAYAYPRGNGRHHHQLAAVADIVVEPDSLKTVIRRERGVADEIRNRVVIRQMGDELEAELSCEYRHAILVRFR